MAVLFICVCLILKLTLVAGQPGEVHYVLKGREATLPTGLPNAPQDILWKHNGDKVIIFDSKEERVFPPYQGRVTLSWDTAELTIADVRYEDSGEYELDAFIRNKLHRSQYMLKVLDKVSKPVIQCELNDKSGNSTSVRGTLHCSSDSNTPEVLTFKWNLEGKSHLGQALNIALGDEHDHLEYSCTASNPMHEETDVFMAKDCHTAERSSKALDVIVPIVIASLILLAFCIFPFIFRHQIKRACFRREKSNDLEKQRTVADKGSSLRGEIHRQETFASKQPLIQQNEEASPQRQEIYKNLEEIRSLGNVKKISKKFLNQEGNDTDRVETATSQPASPIRNGQVDSEGETDNNAPKTEGDRDTDSDHSSNGSEQTETQALLSKPDEHESRGQTDSTGVPDAHHSEHEDVLKSDEAGDPSSSHSGQEEEDTKAPEQADTQAHLETSAPQEDALQFTDKESAESNEESEPIEPESKEQVSPAEDSPPAPEDKNPHGDSDHESVSSNNKAKKAEDAAPTDVLSTSPDSESPDDGVSSQSDQNQHSHSGPNVEVRGDKESDSSPDSSSEKSKESKPTCTAEITPTGESEQPGLEKESDESTHPPASALSKRAHNEESKDIDAENASSAQVSEETKDNTDKESDSSGSGQINEPMKSKEGRQQS